jgi:hypothetical protein
MGLILVIAGLVIWLGLHFAHHVVIGIVLLIVGVVLLFAPGHRAVKGGGLVWHQFWTWWLYNPKTYAGRGAHEGDWELVQLGCADDAGDRPVLVTCSQHSGGEKREFWRVSLHEKRPKVFVARDSHANYFAPERDVTDVADGRGPVLGDIEWREFGPWASWPGRWGHSSNSPGPLSSRRAWVAPHAWHGQARG